MATEQTEGDEVTENDTELDREKEVTLTKTTPAKGTPTPSKGTPTDDAAASTPAPVAKATPKASKGNSKQVTTSTSITTLFQKGHGGSSGGGKKAAPLSNKEVSRSSNVLTEAGLLIQMFDDASSIFNITLKKMDDVVEKIKGQGNLHCRTKQTYMMMTGQVTSNLT